MNNVWSYKFLVPFVLSNKNKTKETKIWNTMTLRNDSYTCRKEYIFSRSQLRFSSKGETTQKGSSPLNIKLLFYATKYLGWVGGVWVCVWVWVWVWVGGCGCGCGCGRECGWVGVGKWITTPTPTPTLKLPWHFCSVNVTDIKPLQRKNK
jgi:hypothetical protein